MEALDRGSIFRQSDHTSGSAGMGPHGERGHGWVEKGRGEAVRLEETG